MKRWIVILVALTMAALGGAALARIYLHRVVKSEVSEVFMRYKDRDDLQVGFVKAYRIDDSTFVDVTTLTARDSASWESLLREMNYPELLINFMIEDKNQGIKNVGTYYCKKGCPDIRTEIDIPNCDLVVVSSSDNSFYVFNIVSKEQAHLIMNIERSKRIHKKISK